MNFNVYLVERIDGYTNKGESISYDYTKDFEDLKAERGYIKEDYFVTDSEYELGNVYFCGDLIKAIKKITSFDGEAVGVKPVEKSVTIAKLAAGDHLKYGGVEWVKLDDAHGGSLILAADVQFDKAFNSDSDAENTNNWKTSPLREYLDKKYIDKLIKAGAKSTNFIDFLRDLTTDDGMTD